jgi:hypothetical protein
MKAHRAIEADAAGNALVSTRTQKLQEKKRSSRKAESSAKLA